MNVKSIIIVVIGLLVSVTAYSQQPKETTMDLLTHTVCVSKSMVVSFGCCE